MGVGMRKVTMISSTGTEAIISAHVVLCASETCLTLQSIAEMTALPPQDDA